MGRRGTIEEMVKIAESRGGKCLSSTYVNNRTKLEWVCSQGHTWFAIPHNVKQGSWCPICSRKEGQRYKKLTIDEMQEIAKLRGGMCLSNEYVDSKTKLKWRCKDGHEWESAPNNIKSGSWCPSCTKYKAEERCRYIFEELLNKKFKKSRKVINGFELDGFNRELMLAFEYHGKQHYEYVPFFHRSIENFNKRIQRDFEKERLCEKQGIRLITIPHDVANSDNELISFIKSKLIEYKVQLENENVDLSNYYKSLSILIELKRLAEKRGGKLLSNYYINSESKLKWECEQKHVWYTTPTVIKGGHWCPVCAGNTKLSMEELQQIAHNHGGKCLTTEYVNNHTKMKWQCAKKHIWETTGGTIRAGTWCPRCAATKR